MEENKILEILKNMPYGMNLYSSAFGKVEFNGIRYFTGGAKLGLIAKEGAIWYKSSGKYREDGEVTLYPSKEMHDWDKFAWKKGDVLVNSKGTFCIFKEFSSYPYTTFIATFVNSVESIISGSTIKVTQEWHKASSEDAEKYIEYIYTNLKKVNRRLNLETLEVENIRSIPKRPKPTYKKESDTPEHEFEPFEKVLVRDQKTDKWTVDLYGFEEKEDGYNYQCVGGCCVYCIPYKGNEHLLGTTNNQEE